MKTRGMILLSVAWVLVLAAVSWWAWAVLPPGALLPMHWNAAGEIDRYADKGTALMMPPLVAAALALVFCGIAAAEPRVDNLAKSRGLFRAAWIGAMGLFGAIELAVIGTGLHWRLQPMPLIFGAMGMMFLALGNQLSKSRQMYMVGIRTPWTLADPDVWIATHRLGGKLMMLAGLVWLVCALGGWISATTIPLLVLGMMAASLVPVFYSYLLWRQIGQRN